MNDSLQMYTSLITFFCQHIPRANYGDIRRLFVLVWAVVALCLTKTVNFNQWGEVVISQAVCASSHQRRFQRLLYNKQVKPLEIYFPLLKTVFSQWPSHQTLFLALDASDLKNGYILIRLALIYRGRAIPICWRVIKHNGTSVGYRDYKILLKQALLILPSGHPIVLLADRGFVHAKLVKFCQKNKWGYRLRAKSNTVVRLADGRILNFAQLRPPKGHAHFYHHVHIMGKNIGPVHIAIGTPDTGEEPWNVISDVPTSVLTLDDYALRFDVEEGFLDDKSAAFRVEDTKLDDPEALERLFLVLAIAVLHLTSVGVAVVKQQTRRWVDTHWDRGLSYLRIGLGWVKQQFRKHWPIMPPFGLDPAPDPEPAIASRFQAAKPKRQWVVSCFGDA